MKRLEESKIERKSKAFPEFPSFVDRYDNNQILKVASRFIASLFRFGLTKAGCTVCLCHLRNYSRVG
jgi:hypothetical protein